MLRLVKNIILEILSNNKVQLSAVLLSDNLTQIKKSSIHYIIYQLQDPTISSSCIQILKKILKHAELDNKFT